jgi:quercetin dioxygenase-like cupin family protein
MANATLTKRMTTISDGVTYRVAEHRVSVKRRADSGGEGESLFEAATPPGGTMPTYQQPDVDESFLILDGAYTFEIGGARFELGPGGYVFVPRGIPRSFCNVSCVVARMLVLVSPGARPESFFARQAAPEFIDVILQDVA